MKICLLNDSFPPIIDGVANVVKNYAEILQEKCNAEVMVATPEYPNGDYNSQTYKVVPYKSFDTTGIVSGYRAGNPFDFKAIKEITGFKPDIIHTHCPIASTVMARIIHMETNAPIVFTYHTKFDVDIARAFHSEFLQKEGIKILVDNISACDKIWVVSEGAGENLKSIGYNGEYTVMYNGVDFAKGKVDDDYVKTVTQAYDLPDNVPVYLFVGRMMKYKGLELILDAMKILSERGKNFRMVLVGAGADLEEMKQKAQTQGIADKVIFTGAEYDRNVLRAWNTRADLFLFPSTYDTNGLVVREAAACGLASVLVENSCAAEGITDGRNGYLIEQNAQAMADKLDTICDNLDKVHEVGQKAMEEIYISWDDAVLNAYNKYEQILSEKTNYICDENKEDFSIRVNKFLESKEKIFHLPKKLYDIVREGIYEGMKENSWDEFEKVKEKKDNINKEIKNLLDNIKP